MKKRYVFVPVLNVPSKGGRCSTRETPPIYLDEIVKWNVTELEIYEGKKGYETLIKVLEIK